MQNWLAPVLGLGRYSPLMGASARDTISPQAREYVSKLALAGVWAIATCWLTLLVHGGADMMGRAHATFWLSVGLFAIMAGLNWRLGSTAIFADMKWLVIGDIAFSATVWVAYGTDHPVATSVYNSIRHYIDVETNVLFALIAVRLVWCRRDGQGAFLRMPPLNGMAALLAAIRLRTMSPWHLVTNTAVAAGVVGLAWWVYAFVSAPRNSAAGVSTYILILAISATPSAFGLVRELIGKEMERRAFAKAQAKAQAETEAKERERAEEERKRHDAEQAAQAAIDEMHHTQRLFKGFAQRTMRLQDDCLTAVATAQRAETQMARTLTAHQRARADLTSTRAELDSIRAELRYAKAELHRTRTELNREVNTLRQEAVVLRDELEARGKYVFEWGLDAIGPNNKVVTDEVRTAIAALNPDSPTYSAGLRVAVQVLMLVQATPKENQPETIKEANYRYTMAVSKFMVREGLVNQYKQPNESLVMGAVHIALARPDGKARRKDRAR